jgi:FtsZ-binding cell division protein ZapB
MSIEVFEKLDTLVKGYHDFIKSKIEQFEKDPKLVNPIVLALLHGVLFDIDNVQYDSSSRSKILLYSIEKIELRLNQLEIQTGHDVKELQKSQKELQEMKDNIDRQVKERTEKIKKEQENMSKKLPGIE